MNNKQQQKLDSLIQKRQQKVESLNNFGEFFERFFYTNLKRAISTINDKLETFSHEGLRIYNENPFENKRTRYFVMVQLISSSFNRNNFFLDNTSSFPSLLFEGDEFTGKVKSTIRFENKLNKSSEHEISQLKEQDVVSEILIDFLERIYSL